MADKDELPPQQELVDEDELLRVYGRAEAVYQRLKAKGFGPTALAQSRRAVMRALARVSAAQARRISAQCGEPEVGRDEPQLELGD